MSLSPVQSLRQPYGNPTGTLRNCSRLHVFISGCVYTMVTCNIWMMHVCFQGPVQLKVHHIWTTACCYAAEKSKVERLKRETPPSSCMQPHIHGKTQEEPRQEAKAP